MSLILDVAPRPLEKVLYFVSYIVTHMDKAFLNDHWDAIKEAVADQICEEVARDEHIRALKEQLEQELQESEDLTEESAPRSAP